MCVPFILRSALAGMNPVSGVRERFMLEYGRDPLKTVFITVSAVLLAVFVVCVIATGGSAFSKVLFADRSDFFMDFFNSAYYGIDLPYTKHSVIYPPLVTAVYAWIGDICARFVEFAPNDTIGYQLRNSQMGMMALMLSSAIALSGLALISRRAHEGTRNDTAVMLLLLSSFPVVYALERGNSILFTVLFVLVFILGYRSENRYVRYMSYVALGLSVGIKVYTVFFGLLILRDRNYREMSIALSIVMLVFMVPFLLTDGSVYNFYTNAFSYTGSIGDSDGSFYSIRDFLNFFRDYASVSVLRAVQLALYAIMYLILLLAALLCGGLRRWQFLTLACCAITLGVGTSTTYNYCLFIIPLLFFLHEEKAFEGMNRVYVILFAMMFVWLPAFSAGTIAFVKVIHTIPAFILQILVAAEFFRNVRGGVRLDSPRIMKETPFKGTIAAVLVSAVILMATAAAPLVAGTSEVVMENMGTNTLRLVEDGEDVEFSYDPETGVFATDADGEYRWYECKGPNPVVTEKGFVGTSSAAYVDSGGSLVQFSYTGGWSGKISGGTVTVDYTDADGNPASAQWTYSGFALVASPSGTLSYFTSYFDTYVVDVRLYLEADSVIYASFIPEDTSMLLGIRDTVLWADGEEYADSVKYEFGSRYSYPELRTVAANGEFSTIVLPALTEGNNRITAFVTDSFAVTTRSVSDSETGFTYLVMGSLAVIVAILLGLVFLSDRNPRLLGRQQD